MGIVAKTRIILGIFLFLGSLTSNLGKVEQVNLVHHGELHVQPRPTKVGGDGVWNMQGTEHISMVRRGKKGTLNFLSGMFTAISVRKESRIYI